MSKRQWLPEVVVQAMDRVEQRLDERWTLERVAAQASFSPFHFHRLFREATGETPRSFVERLRLERAALLLLAGEQSITDLAWSLGFRHPETLARRFRAHFGLPARDYRRLQLEAWARLGLVAGEDPLPEGTIEVRRFDPGPIEVRRACGPDEGFDFSERDLWCDDLARPDEERFGITLDALGITPPERLRQDWGRRARGTAGFVRRAPLRGLYASLEVDGPGPVPNEVYQRLFVWSLGGRHRLRAGPVMEIASGDRIRVLQPVFEKEPVIEEGRDVRVRS